MIRGVVFDFDGVLADSEPLHLRALQQLLESLGIALDAREYYDRYVGYDDVGVFRILATEHGWKLTDEGLRTLIDEKSSIFDALIASADVLFPTAQRCIDTLGAMYPLGIASGALKHEIKAILRRYALVDRFQFIVASGDTPESKPAPDPYLRAAQLHGLRPEECVAIEDTHWGIVSARSAGLKCVGIATTYPRNALSGADVVIDSLEEFTPALISSI